MFKQIANPSRSRFLTLLTLFLLLFSLNVPAKQKSGADIRVLIDVSGSMRQNDPQNLRRPALRMLVGLVQPGTHAGVWTFGRWVNMLVPSGEVDEAWKKQAMGLSNEIGSPGQFTNIEEVLDRATQSWEGNPAKRHRHLVLLTDGMVDISKSDSENAASRRRILDTLLPRIKAQDARIHTIALSERADHDLLKQLAAETDGWYEQINDADRLKRIFLRIFEKVGKPDSVPLKDNKFRVDKRVQEATVLIFRNANSPATYLTRPDGHRFGRMDMPDSISWHSDEGYELITLREPQAGTWSLEADIDPDNRVMVLTDLKLVVSNLPSQLVVGEKIHVSASLNSQGKLVKRRAFLDLVDMRADSISAIGLDPQPLNDRGRRGDDAALDGRYGMVFSEARPQPLMELVMAAESSTFLREKRHSLSVVEPASLQVGNDQKARLELVPAAMRADTVNVQLWHQSANGEKQALMAIRQPDGSWQADVRDTTLPVGASVQGVTKNGNPIKRDLPLVYPAGVAPVEEIVPAEPEAKPELATTQPVIEAPAVADAAEKTEKAEVATEEEEKSWLMPVLVLGISNFLIFGGGLAFWLIRRRRAKRDELSLEEEALPGDDVQGDE